jgi:hypothetical protein
VIVGVAVCPGAPFLVHGTATAIARAVPHLLAACGEAVDRLPAADRTLLIGSRRVDRDDGPSDGSDASSMPTSRAFPPGTVVRTSVTRGDISARGARMDAGTSGGNGAGNGAAGDDLAAGAAPGPSVATLVGAHLLRAARHATPTTAVEVSAGGSAPVSADIPPELNTGGPDRVTVLVIADGAACHGDDAPGRRDDRSDAFDAALARALAAGDPAALGDACRNPELPADAVMASVNPLALLADLTRSAPPDAADLLYSGAPFGVGYFVASWRWNQA